MASCDYEPEKSEDTKALLSERGKTHGDFFDNARISQAIKRVFHAAPRWSDLHDCHKEALEMIASKSSRILSGQADHADHFADIAGYAKLAEAACRKRTAK